MNICYVAIDIALPTPTGGSTHTLEMAHALSEQGDSIIIVSRREKGQSKTIMINSIRISRIYRLIFFPLPFETGGTVHFDEDKHRFLARLYDVYLRTVYALYAAIGIAKVIKKYNVQVVFERATSLGAGAMAARFTHRPLVEEVITACYSPLSLRTAKRILTYSKDMLPDWVEEGKIITVTAAVNTRLFNPVRGRETIRRKYSLNDKPVIAYSGGFWEHHGVDTLIDASKAVIAKHPRSVFLMIGPDYHRYESRARSLNVADHFVFTGPIPYEEVPDFLAAADILVAPYSRLTTSPLKLFEYLALQKPVIASKISSIENVIKDGQTGILVPPRDPKVLGREINRLLEQPELAQRIAKQGYNLIEEKYTWKHLSRTVQRCCDDLLRRRTGAEVSSEHL